MLAGAPAWAVQDCDLNGESVNPANGSTTRGKTGLMRCKDRDSAEVVREQELRNGQFVGVVRYFERGVLQREYFVNDRGNQHGRAREFAANGQVLRDAEYVDGSVSGLALGFYPDGKLRRAAFHQLAHAEQAYAEYTERAQLAALRCADRPLLAPVVDDTALCGFTAPSQVEFFRSNGNLSARARYEGGRRVRHEVLQANGQPSSVDEINGDRRLERAFGPDGAKRREIESVAADRGFSRVRESEYAASGSLQRERRWSQGELVLEHEYYLNGQSRRKSEHRVEAGSRLSQISEYFDTGTLARSSTYLSKGRYANQAVGTHQRFFENGRLASESTHDTNGKLVRERAWDAAGTLLRDDEVFEDGSRKAYSK